MITKSTKKTVFVLLCGYQLIDVFRKRWCDKLSDIFIDSNELKQRNSNSSILNELKKSEY